MVYTSDFLTGTLLMSDQQVGKYTRTIFLMHQTGGRMQRVDFDAFVGDERILRSKFKIGPKWVYQKRLKIEMDKRADKSKKLTDNAHKRWEKEPCKSNAIASNLHSGLHMPIEDENANEKLLIQQIQEVFAHFCFTLKKKILLSPERRSVIAKRLKEGRTVAEMTTAINHFAADDWSERHKFCDLVYVIGVRNKVDNLDKWLVGKGIPMGKAVAADGHPSHCPDCHGRGLVLAPGSGKNFTCLRKY